ncbi:hypothetical protein [Streptomyces sp. MST-110588]|uniref:DUF6895 family protein n=1 Tax=Streptomyces sp. MST-110588 TaxID=2833628 RepID=UPI001F5C33B7|nr:hypothetical protein [Streptomyces sp. MST-110588]
MNWLEAHREHFRLRLNRDTPARQVKERLKPVGELALVGRILTREGVTGSRQAAQIRRLLDFAWQDVLEGGEVLAWMQRDEPLSPVPLELYVPFRELGYSHPGVAEHARLVSRTTSWRALEAPPSRRLGIARFAARAGLPAGIDEPAAVRRTWLGHTPEPWTVDHHIAYAVTHTVFHLTDWGERLGNLPEDIARYLTLWLPVWTEEWALHRHWDLLGELLVVDACLPRPALDTGIWQRYADAQSPEGAMPVQHTMPTGDAGEIFDLVHHPTLVAVFASTMAVSRAMTALSDSAP